MVFAYPPEEQEMQIFRKAPGKEAEPLVGEAKAAACGGCGNWPWKKLTQPCSNHRSPRCR